MLWTSSLLFLSALPGLAQAQTVVNLSNTDPGAASGTGNAATALDLTNTSAALTMGGLAAGAVSRQSQAAYNQINVLGQSPAGALAPVTLGGAVPQGGAAPAVSINESTSAHATPGLAAGSSATIVNLNAAVSGAVNPIIGAPAATNGAFTGGYGPTPGNVLAGGGQTGLNTANAAAATFQPGTGVTLSQLPGTPPSAAGAPVTQGGALNMSVVNTLLAYTPSGAATVDGAGGTQSAGNSFNSATLQGASLAAAVQQKADGLNPTDTTLQSVNRALAFSSGAHSANIDPSVATLGQTASTTVNTLSMSGGGALSLSGQQSIGTTSGAPQPVVSNQAVASTVGVGGFLPDTTSTAWAGFASTIAPAMPDPATYGTTARLTQNGGMPVNGVGDTRINTLAAGATSLTLGAAGFTQRSGDIALLTAMSPNAAGGLNNAVAETGAGAASVTNLGQALDVAVNGLAATGNVTGGLTQRSTSVNFAGGLMGGPTAAPVQPGNAASAVAAPNGGSGIAEGVAGSANSGPYAVYANPAYSGAILQTPTWNTATANTGFGTASASTVRQSVNARFNSMSAAGVIDSGAASTVSQSLDLFAINCGCTTTPYSGAPAGQSIQANATSRGASTVSAATQTSRFDVNAVSGAAGVNGSVAQTAMSAPAHGSILNAINPSNTIGANVAGSGQGESAITDATQVNAVALNSIAATGPLGILNAPAAFSQSIGNPGGAPATRPIPGLGGAAASAALPWNNSTAQSATGAGAGASVTAVTQVATMTANQVSGSVLNGNTTQLASGSTFGSSTPATLSASAVGNMIAALAISGDAGTPIVPGYSTAPPPGNGTSGLGADGVASGNAITAGTRQVAQQSLNSVSVNGAVNGQVNQATIAGSQIGSGNKAVAQANRGIASAEGTQLSQNALNTTTKP